MSKKDNMFSTTRDWLRKINWFNNSIIAKGVFVLIIAVLCFIPAYISIFLWCLVSPSGFWPVFAMLALMLCVFGSAQLWFVILSVMAIVVVLTDENTKENTKEYKYEEDIKNDDWDTGDWPGDNSHPD